MKYLVIITRQNDEFDSFWSYDKEVNEAVLAGADCSIILFKKSRHKTFVSYALDIANKLSGKAASDIGVLFHSLNDDVSENLIVQALPEELRRITSFCSWYSSSNTKFWSNTGEFADLPYNNLKNAWRKKQGSKEDTFNVIWNCFVIDQSIERPLEILATALPFDYVYNNDAVLRNAKNELQKAINKK